MKTIITLPGRLGLAFLAMALLTLSGSGAWAQTFAPAPTPAATTPSPSPAPSGSGPEIPLDPMVALNEKTYTGEKITLDFQNADIHNILRLIGEVSGMNVVVSDQVSGKITLKLRDVPWDQALDIVLVSKQLGKTTNGNVLRIDLLDNIKRSFPDPSDPNAKITLIKETFTPKYSSVSAVAAELEKTKSPRGRVRVIGNDIYVEDDFATLRDLREVFQRNDKVTKQILIEARIVEASTDFSQNLGIRWGGYGGHKVTPSKENNESTMSDRHKSSEAVGLPAGSSTAPSFPSVGEPGGTTGSFYPGEHFGLLDIGGASGAMRLGYGFLNRSGTMLLNAELSANETLGETKVISAPRIMASNDNEVYIKQGTQVPYQSYSANAGTSTEFKDALMELRVTPHIEENGQIISLDITLTKDNVNRIDSTTEPSIDKKEAKTKLMVRDGETVVIGGIIEDNQSNSTRRVPGLHAIPLLGWLFQDRGVQANKRELLVFITANIIPINI
ncbi:MAG: type IV pilus secretin PilQ [Deltaproteobacteria bacterium]|jgi:type IV pilus assembly protein PilQ|nr:type IV pilus secretin PilQ [Deltaproteobacteria bacterium]